MATLNMVSEDLAGQALSNLVNQFARPLDFLRELVQNSLDAGSPRVDVWIEFTEPEAGQSHGVLAIHVDDHGEGMDEGIIDQQLTRLFSSNKEDDLTKIGKFGIGFTSIFAIQPEAVLLRTGRHGESWELLFHKDRSFDKVRIDAPISGTKITLYKHMEPARVPPFVREARWVLGYWCEHSSHPITFEDRTGSVDGPSQSVTSDPFAAFSAPAASAREQVNTPLALEEANLSMVVEEDGLILAIGYADQPRYGFYNGGLTLVSATSADVLGDYQDLAHLSFKVKCNALEHTLTRDNVLQDEAWQRVMDRIRHHAGTLRERLVARTREAVAARESLDVWHDHLADEAYTHGRAWVRTLLYEPVFVDDQGAPLTLASIEKQENSLGVILLSSDHVRLTRAVRELGHHLLDPEPSTVGFLGAFARTAVLGIFQSDRVLQRADERFALPDLLARDELTSRERKLFDATEHLLDAALPGTFSLRLGDFGGPEVAGDEVLALSGPSEGGLFSRTSDSWMTLPSFGRSTCLLVNRHHELFRALVVASSEDLPTAAFSLAQALLIIDGRRAAGPYDRLLTAVTDAYLAEVEAG